MDKDTILRRLKAARNLERRLRVICNSLDKIPSYEGKAKFMDKVTMASNYANALANELELDSKYTGSK